VPIAESTAAVNGVELFTRSAGPDGAPEMVVLHGGPGAHHDYLLPQFDALARGRRLRYYDQRGGGRSPVGSNVDVRWRAHVADLEALLDLWKLERASILGYSWGGLLAMLFAVEHPERTGRLALVSPAPATAAGRAEFEAAFAERMGAPKVMRARAELTRSGLRERDPAAYRRRGFELSVAGYFHDFANVRGLTPFRVTGRTQQAVWESLGDYDLRPALARLELPARVFHGRYDPIPLHTAEETAGLLHADLVIFQHSGHVPYLEDYDQFVTELNRWLPRAP
jgi:proline iminopeptidase